MLSRVDKPIDEIGPVVFINTAQYQRPFGLEDTEQGYRFGRTESNIAYESHFW